MKKKDKNVNEPVETLDEAAPGADLDLEFTGGDADPDLDEVCDDIPEAAVSEQESGEDNPFEEALALLQQERDEYRDQVLRARAEFDNYRKRMLREGEMLRKTATQNLMRGLLPIVDNLERALSHVENREDGLARGVEMIVKQFADVLAAQGLEPIPAKGEPFDPNIHEALTHQPSETVPADTVMEEFQRGYRLGDFVVRPSQVVVSSGAPPQAEAAGESGPAEPGDAQA